jgi:hypothetical protein
MLIYPFVSYRHPSVTAFTSDRTGGNLPADYASWSPVNNGRAIQLASLCEPIAESVRQHGYFLLAGGCAYSRIKRDLRRPPKTGQAAKRESSLGTAGWPEVRLVEYTEETQS